MGSKEQRNFPRITTSIRVWVRESDADVPPVVLTLKDISEGGLFVQSSLLWEPGERFELFFTIPGSPHEIRAIGEVVRAEDKYLLFPDMASQEPPVPGMGIRFVDIAPEDRQRIRDLLGRPGEVQPSDLR